MSDTVATAGQVPGTPVTINMPAMPSASPAPAQDFQRMSQEQFQSRLEEASEAGAKRMLKEFGVPKDQRAETLAKIRSGAFVLAPKPADGEPDYRTEYQKIAPEYEKIKAELEPLKTKYTTRVKKEADAAFAALPENAQAYIVGRAGEDPEKRLAEIEALKSSGLIAVNNVAAPTVARPATTIGANGPSVTPNAAPTAYQQWAALNDKNPELAAQFRRMNHRAIEASKPST